MNCPKCCSQLVKILDYWSGIEERVCPSCAYYESDSEAFKESPTLFADLGKVILRKRVLKFSELGYTQNETKAWLGTEPDFAKRIVTPLNNKQEGNRTVKRKVFMKLLFVLGQLR
jgi:hypothetical protein